MTTGSDALPMAPLDRCMAEFDVNETHDVELEVAPEAAIRCVLALPAGSDRIVRFLFRLRGLRRSELPARSIPDRGRRARAAGANVDAVRRMWPQAWRAHRAVVRCRGRAERRLSPGHGDAGRGCRNCVPALLDRRRPILRVDPAAVAARCRATRSRDVLDVGNLTENGGREARMSSARRAPRRTSLAPVDRRSRPRG